MSEDCDELNAELDEHEEKSVNLFKEAEKLHQKALQTPISKRSEEMSKAFAKQKEALEEIQLTEEIKNKLREEHCDEKDQSRDLLNKETQENFA